MEVNKDYMPTEGELYELSEAQSELALFLEATQCVTEAEAFALAADYDTCEKCDEAVEDICHTFQLSFAFMRDDPDMEEF